MKKFLVVLFVLGTFVSLQAQKYFTKSGNISFNASSPLEPIEGSTRTASCVLDVPTGNIEFAVLIKTFLFTQALMQEHFNENYMESNKFPKGSFKGRIDNIKDVNFKKDGTYKVKLSGNLEIHGVTKPISTTADFIINSSKIRASSNIVVALADYNIKIPGAVSNKIAKSAKISILADFQELKK
ncbi:MAG: YceI family protein [Saprospiraceae bacterium]